MIGNFARAKAGHDKGVLYVIVSEDKENVYLSDGRLKLAEKPKKKNKKHIQIINKICDESLKDKINKQDKALNEAIKRAIKLYERED